MRRLTLVLLFALLPALPAAAQKQSLSYRAFFGHYLGSGISESADSLYFGVTVRDLDVTIAPATEGFLLSWTTVLRQGGDPKNPDVRRKSTEYLFLPTAQPDVFRAKTSGDPLAGQEMVWSRITRNTLITYIMTIGGDGAYSMQSYERTLTGDGMELVFKRVSDGERNRTVKAKLVKVAQ